MGKHIRNTRIMRGKIHYVHLLVGCMLHYDRLPSVARLLQWQKRVDKHTHINKQYQDRTTENEAAAC